MMMEINKLKKCAYITFSGKTLNFPTFPPENPLKAGPEINFDIGYIWTLIFMIFKLLSRKSGGAFPD